MVKSALREGPLLPSPLWSPLMLTLYPVCICAPLCSQVEDVHIVSAVAEPLGVAVMVLTDKRTLWALAA